MQLLNIRTITGAALLAAALVVPGTAMAQDRIYLQFKSPNVGLVPVGESTNAAYKDWIELRGYEWGVENVVNIGTSSRGGGAGKVAFSELNITKTVDKATNTLLDAACRGTNYGDATIVVTRNVGGTTEKEYLKLEMKTVFVSRQTMSVSDGGDRASENVTLVFGSMQSTYTPYDGSGKAGTPVIVKWSVVTNTPAFRPADEAKADPVPAGSPPASTGTKITVK